MAQPRLLEGLAGLLGPWAVSSPTRWVATQALADRDWQQGNRRYLAAAGEHLADVLMRRGLPPASGCGLFQWVRAPGNPDSVVHRAAESEIRFAGNRSGLGAA